jgi:hypothetical protein
LCTQFACFTGTKVQTPTQKLKADTLAQAAEGAEVVASLAAGLKAEVETKQVDEREGLPELLRVMQQQHV